MSEAARILLIDDDGTVRSTIWKSLQKAGFIVDPSDNGEEALQKSDANFYNLALIDIRLPDMERTKLLTAMKDTTPKMIKIMLTGYSAHRTPSRS
jgi:DNA-binding NtrC family response regulator